MRSSILTRTLFTITCCIVVSGLAAAARDQVSEPEWQKYDFAAKDAESKGDLPEAERLRKKAIETAERTSPKDALPILNDLATFYYKRTNNIQAAETTYKHSLELCVHLSGTTDCSVELLKLAGFYESVHRYNEAEPLYKRAMENWEQGDPRRMIESVK